MIVFDLICPQTHLFEAWFGSSAAYEEQRAAGMLSCPVCGSAEVVKAVMAPAVATRGNRTAVSDPATARQAMRRLAAEQARVLASSEWVGTRFADRARAMHAGEEPRVTIHGQATLAEAKALVSDGVPVVPLPLPVVPPERIN